MKNNFECFDDGYEVLLDRFTHVLKDNKKIFFSGAFGVGKTTFLEKWVERNCSENYCETSKNVTVNEVIYNIIVINAFNDFHSESFVEVLESKLFHPFCLFIKKYLFTILVILSPLVILFFKWLGWITINTSSSDIMFFMLGLCSMVVAIHQYRQNSIVEVRIKRIKKECSKNNYLFIIDDFDRLSHTQNESASALISSSKDNILKIMSFVESERNIVIFVGDIQSNDMNFLEKYYDFIYVFPVLSILREIKTNFVEYWEKIISARGNLLDAQLFSDFKSHLLFHDRNTSIRDIIRLNNHLDTLFIERLNISEVILTHYLYYTHNDDYTNIFEILMNYKTDFMNGEKYYKEFNEKCFADENNESDKKLKKIIIKWLSISEWNRNSRELAYIRPPGDRMEFETCRENCYLYIVNQFDNNEYTYEEFAEKIIDLEYWINTNKISILSGNSNNNNPYYNINRFYKKLKENGQIVNGIVFLLDNIYKLDNIDDVRGFIRGISDLSNWDLDASYGEYYKDIPDITEVNASIQGKVVYLSQILMYTDSNLSLERKGILINFLTDSIAQLHENNDAYVCQGWLSLFFYTKYAKFINEDVSLEFWKERHNLVEDVRRYFFQDSQLAVGYFHIGEESYDAVINEILKTLDGVPEAIEMQRRARAFNEG